MRVTRILVRQAELAYAGTAYAFSGGRSYAAFTTTVVTLETDAGLSGHGETCPCGPAYMPAHAGGVVPALAVLAPAVLGADPRGTVVLADAMDAALAGHEFAKSAVDLAAWDLLGKATGLPVATLLGGARGEVALHRVVPLGSASETVARVAALRARGYRHFQVKLGRDIGEDIAVMRALDAARGPGEVFVGDPNGAWRPEAAMRASAALADIDCLIEEPCPGLAANARLRARLRHPLKLDESLTTLADARAILAADAADAVAVKISRHGGLTRARAIRDVCADAGIAMTVEDAWGGSIVTAAIAHLAASTPPAALLNATDLAGYNATDIATGGARIAAGRMSAPDAPGLGTEPDAAALGPPVAIFEG